MKRESKTRITGKKIVNSKILYHLQAPTFARWAEYENLTEYIDLIIAYEKELKQKNGRNKSLQKNRKNHELADQNVKLEDIVIDEGSNHNKQDMYINQQPKEITNIIFIEKKGDNLVFKVWYQDGNFRYRTNKQLRIQNTAKLLDFYQKNISIGFD